MFDICAKQSLSDPSITKAIIGTPYNSTVRTSLLRMLSTQDITYVDWMDTEDSEDADDEKMKTTLYLQFWTTAIYKYKQSD